MDFSKIKTWTIGGKEVKTLEVNGQVYWKKEEVPPVECKAFYVEDASGSANNLSIKNDMYGASDVRMEYSNDGKQWQEWTDKYNTAIPIGANGRVYLRGNNTNFNLNRFECSNRYNVGGDITTLLDPKGNVLDLTGRTRCFMRMFSDSMRLESAENLKLTSTILSGSCYWGLFDACISLVKPPKLPATTLAKECYNYMFQRCTSLVSAPELPATTLADRCYPFMFSGCTSLVSAPELPATTLADSCYEYMFKGCSSLKTAPKLPATELVYGCYNNMFSGCTSLVSAPELLATTLAEECYYYMFDGCSSLKTAPKLPATTLAKKCYYYMFKGCSSLKTAPKLPATELVYGCYNSMFSGCTSLVSAPELPAMKLAEWCYCQMFVECSSLVNAPELPATTLSNYCYYNMFSGCKKLNSIKVGATSWDINNSQSWVYGVSPTGTFTKPKGVDIPSGTSGIPDGWTIVEV